MQRTNWQDERSYDYLKAMDRSGFAWEFLRRNPEYRKHAGTRPVVRQLGSLGILTPPTTALRWGLLFR